MKATTKQTAVECLIKELEEIPNYSSFYTNNYNWVDSIIKQAKEMEREQISQAYVYGSAYGIDLENGLNPNNYFKEKYESNA